MIEYNYPKINQRKNPEINGDIDNIGISHLMYARLNLLKECYESLGIDFGDTKNQIQYKNRLIQNPLQFGVGGGIEGRSFFGAYTETGNYFKDTHADNAAKEKMLFGTRLTRTESKQWTEQFIDKAFSPTINGKHVNIGGFHRALTANLQAFCDDLSKIPGFKLEQFWAVTYRPVNNGSGSSKLSLHSYGVAFDINWSKNPFPKGVHAPQVGNVSDPNVFRSFNHPVVQAAMRHGFGWGGRYGDYMHFSFFNGN